MDHIIFIDGDCTLCNRFVDFVVKYDKRDKYKFYSLDDKHETLNTVVLYENKSFYVKYEAVSKVLKQLNLLFKLFFIISDRLPIFLTNKVYDFVANNRNKIFNQDYCIPLNSDQRVDDSQISSEIIDKAYKLSRDA
tara:strand:+ start:11860 stop:12267 length:408 start_codon:yes stop_codon:yes gene_type:complete